MEDPSASKTTGQAGEAGPHEDDLARVPSGDDRYRTIAELTSDYAYAYRVEPEGTLIPEWLTDSFTRVLGYTAGEIGLRGLQQIIHRADRRVVMDQGRRALAGQATVAEYRVVTKLGEIRWVRNYARPGRDAATGRVARIFGAAQDITERRQAETALQSAYDKEKRIAETLQRALLMVPPQEAFASLSFEPIFEPAWDEATVGGDFYDAFPLSGTSAAFVVGDVSGKGLAAAARTAEIKYTLRALLREYPHPGRALRRANELLTESLRLNPNSFDTLICVAVAVIDGATGQATIASAGAEPPLLLRAGGGAQAITAGGFPLAVEPLAEYEETVIRLGPSDVLALTTDGITEARSGNQFFGYEGFLRVAEEALSSGSAAIGQAVLDAARAFAGGRLQDDACLLVLRRQ